MDTTISRLVRALAIAAVFALVSACGDRKSEVANGDAGTGGGPRATRSIGGTVFGLVGTMVLEDNGSDSLDISANGAFAFSTAVTEGNLYSITVLTQPAGQTCTVANGAGTVSKADVTNVTVACAANAFSVGGTVSGLSGNVVLQVNGGSNFGTSTSGPFTFDNPLADGSKYDVTVHTQPTGQSCSVTGGTGTIAGANVTNVSVSCASNTFTVGGTVSGLSGSVVLQNNLGNNLTVSANGSFAFPAALRNGSGYNVTVLAAPSDQTCTVVNGAGTVNGANISNVVVSCVPNTFTVGGTVSGLSGSVALQNNLGNNLTVSLNGSFTFSSALRNGSSYNVTVLAQPVGQTCTVANGSGTVSGADILNVSVNCVTNTYKVGGTVSGLSGSVVLQNNLGNNLTVSGNGGFIFSTALQNGSTYNVTVLTQPSGQTCIVADGSGTVSGANISNVGVNCLANTYQVGGTVSGLSGSVVLQNNLGNTTSVSGNGGFIFSAPLQNGSTYNVAVLTQPSGQTCTVANGSGTVSGANISNVGVSCVPNTFTVGGTVSGLSGSVVLQNNLGNNLTVSGNGGFVFSTALQNGSTYNVTVLTQPSGQTCTVANGSGTVSGANISNVGVSCVANTFSVGGMISGLTGSVVLSLNGTSTRTLSVNETFSFPTGVPNGAPYSVTVQTQPAGQTCTVSNGAGTVSGNNVTNVSVICATNTFSVGGAVSGLVGTVVLQINGGNNLSVSASGLFTFGVQLAEGSAYSVTVLTQPTGQSCSVTGGTGTIPGAKVTNVGVSCVANAFTVGGTVSGISGSVVLQNNLGNDLTVSASGSFTFSSALQNGRTYSVTVLTQPLGQTCTVSNGAGTVSGNSVTNVNVICATNTFSVGGAVSGLVGTVVLQINGGNNLSVSGNGPFTFTSQLADGTPYAVTVLTQPAGQSCSVAGGTGAIPGANVSNVGVSCFANAYTVGGTVSGLSGSVMLRNNGGNDLTVSVNGNFTFPSALQNGSTYSVSVLTQPQRQTCTVSNGAGTVTGSNVATVAVICTTNTFSVGGTVSGIVGTVVLRNNGTDSLSISTNGVFTFPTTIADGGPYSVAVLMQPANQTCTVVNGAGTVGGADVSNVGVNCVANTFALGGTVTGLSGSVVLQNNGGNSLTVAVDGSFVFPAALQNGSAYNVTVLTQPVSQTCTVSNGAGTVSATDVANVAVICATNTFSVGGTVSGLVGAAVLRINEGNNLTVSANGPFTFSPPLADGSSYNVTVFTQPAGQSCSVAGGTGTIPGANVTNVGVSCVANTFTVGGAVSGLSGSVVLQNNVGNDLTVSANGNFTFSSALQNGIAYSVTVLTQPSNQTCTVSNGAGTVSGNNVANVSVTCATNTFSVGGTISGLTGTVVLRVNGGNDLSRSSNGPFAFPTPLAQGSAYNVTVLTQPAGQSCSVAGGTGTIPGANVTNVGVSCVANTFTVGGTVSGLSGSVVLQNNGGNNLTVLTNGGFTFPSALQNSTPYSVTVLTQPLGQTCIVTNGTGTIVAGNVTNVGIACSGTPGTYAINFTLTENPISDGGKWVNGMAAGLYWNNVQSIPGKAYAGMPSGLNGSRYDDSIAHLDASFFAFPPNQYAQGTVYRAPGYDPSPSFHEVELHLRFQTTAGNARGYEVMWGITGYLAIVRWDGPLGVYTPLLDTGDPGIGAPVDGDVLRAEIRGNALTIYKNGSVVNSIDVTSVGAVWADGQPGMGFWPVDGSIPENYGWKNFEAGALP